MNVRLKHYAEQTLNKGLLKLDVHILHVVEEKLKSQVEEAPLQESGLHPTEHFVKARLVVRAVNAFKDEHVAHMESLIHAVRWALLLEEFQLRMVRWHFLRNEPSNFLHRVVLLHV